jgi:predicted class III extradiol MEMO1 family dioxygenase
MDAMAARMPALRQDLDVMPSPVADRPGLLVRDPMGFAEGMLIVPPPLIPAARDLRRAVRRGRREGGARPAGGRRPRGGRGRPAAGGVRRRRVPGRRHVRRRSRREGARVRRGAGPAARARGSAYPDEAEALARTLDGWLAGARRPRPDLVAIGGAAREPEGGWRSYAAAFGALDPSLAGRTFVVLGTSHYGQAETFGLTRKPFATPFGETTADAGIVGELERAGGHAEDYCHAVEHSIEFQVVFLQHLFGPAVCVVPILCGPFAAATRGEGLPEDDPAVGPLPGRAAGAVGGASGSGCSSCSASTLAHVGRRYGDPESARAHERGMIRVSERDRDRLERVRAGDATGFWRLVQEDADDLKWCGASPLYAFSRTVSARAGAPGSTSSGTSTQRAS